MLFCPGACAAVQAALAKAEQVTSQASREQELLRRDLQALQERHAHLLQQLRDAEPEDLEQVRRAGSR